jgi:hypothetical protein
MLVDHLIKFKGCTHYQLVVDMTTGMRQFIHDRRELLETIPQFADPDFALPERLPVEARLSNYIISLRDPLIIISTTKKSVERLSNLRADPLLNHLCGY